MVADHDAPFGVGAPSLTTFIRGTALSHGKRPRGRSQLRSRVLRVGAAEAVCVGRVGGGVVAEAAVVQDGGAVGDAEALLDAVGGDDGAAAGLAVAVEEAIEGRHRRLVQAGFGLVEQQQRRTVQDRAGEGGALLHAVGKGTNPGGHDRADA